MHTGHLGRRPVAAVAAAVTVLVLMGGLATPAQAPAAPAAPVGPAAAAGPAAPAMPPRTSDAVGSDRHKSTGPAGRAPLALSTTDLLARELLDIRSEDYRLGEDLAGLVTDVETGEVLWSQTPLERQLPASTVKLLTAVNALETFGPDHRFVTEVRSTASRRSLTLVGAGDPSLSVRDLGRLARTAAATVAASGVRSVRVHVDDSLFPAPTMAYGWKSRYLTDDVSPVRALVVDQRQGWDTALDAGQVFADALARRGLAVRSVTRRSLTADTQQVATSPGQPVGTLVRTMLRESDNDYGEALHRLVAVGTGYPPTWEGARSAQAAGLERLGSPLGTSAVYDGSGLSRRDRLSPTDVVAVLAQIFDPAHPRLASLQHDSMAIAGVSGTLAPRYQRYTTHPTRCAAGLIEAKTGSLRGAIALSGLAYGADGQVKLFSFLLNRVTSTLTTRRAADRLATTVTGCW